MKPIFLSSLLLRGWQSLVFVLTLGASLSACSSMTWKEEVLLHDGSKIIAERTVKRGGRHEIGQQPPIKEQSLAFTLPATKERVIWKSEYSKDIGLADFQPLLLDIAKGSAYVVASLVGCLSYNKWGRPNPPYVIFKYQDNEWKHIALRELPTEFKIPNLIFSSPDNEVKKIGKNLVTAAMVQRANNDLTQPEFKTILKEGVQNAGVSRCGEMVYDGKGGWIGVGWFRDQPSYEACLKYCAQQNINAQYCPCSTLFKGK